ncbi:PQQ-binding-like beta-propeller repeat protein [bacterium]|nr:PQQ-binding-like beta-propeller repeat protein [bacterium]
MIPSERRASGVNQNSEFTSGVERFNSSGDVSDNGEASRITSSAGTVSQAMYRIPLGGGQPGVVSVDANLLSGAGYYVGIADYGAGRWQWHGPFSDNHLRFATAQQGPYTSELGNMFISVLVYGGGSADVVGVGSSLVNPADAAAPTAPSGVIATALDSGLLLSWDAVAAPDLAGYRIYSSGQNFINGNSAGVVHSRVLEGLTTHELPLKPGTAIHVRISAVDVSGNESALSEIVSATALAGTAPELKLDLEKPSAFLNEPVSLLASGAVSYDFDLDGDAVFEISGDTSGAAVVDTSQLGIIRPRVRGWGADGSAVALGGVSLVISGNSRPVAVAKASPASGTAPLDVEFDGSESTDFDGSIVGGGWDFDGDGIYDVWDDAAVTHVSAAGNVYSAAASYNAKLRVVDDNGAWDVDTLAISVAAAELPNQAPTADLQADVTSGEAPLTVSFDASGSADSDGTIVEYAWDWDGDGIYDGFTDDPGASHTFTTAGSPSVKLRVEDDRGARSTDTLTITVNVAGNSLPLAVLSVDQDRPLTGQTVTLDASSSSDPDGSIVNYEWDFNGDGVWDASGSTPTVLHAYSSQAGYAAVVRVTDDLGAQALATIQLAATNTAWSSFGSDNLNSHRSPYAGPGTNHLSWNYASGDAIEFGSPAIGADGVIYFGSDDDKLYAINADGSFRWSYLCAGDVIAAPAIGADGTVYFPSQGSRLYALNPDGTLRWKITVNCGSVVIGADGTLYLGSVDKNLRAYNPDGTAKWSYLTGGLILNTPAIGTDGTIYIGTTDHKLYAVMPDGTLNWDFTAGNEITSSPGIGPDGTIYFGALDNKLYAVNPDGTAKWTYTSGGAVYSSPAIGADGKVYFGSFDSKIYSLLPDGSFNWQYIVGADVQSSPAIDTNGNVYVGSSDHKLYALNPAGSLLWSYTTGAVIGSSPAIGANQTVYFGSQDGSLYAVGP